ncbi:hypothetical protein LCGC14_2881620 [marine sediment metagenome]|uniref:Uncharacterized protein n=1 Tax=marine sediment metagenome TaxID=412755 RepID=A0A0F8Y063_9ZZZZ
MCSFPVRSHGFLERRSKMNEAQTVAVALCVIVGVVGVIFAVVGAVLALSNPDPAGILSMVIGTVALGVAGLGVSVTARLLS